MERFILQSSIGSHLNFLNLKLLLNVAQEKVFKIVLDSKNELNRVTAF
jgi:hypothetical protein